jgi:molecular chaperone GrpE
MAVEQPSSSAEPHTGDDEPQDTDLDELRSLKAALVQAQAEAKEMEDRWRRALADLDNYRKRVARDMQRQLVDERARVAGEWLPVLDNLELALDHAGADPDAIIEGVRAVRDQALEVLSRLGFPRRDDLGRRFDPAVHEAVATTSDPSAPPGTVVGVVRSGYGADERLLRPAAVVVAAGTE